MIIVIAEAVAAPEHLESLTQQLAFTTAASRQDPGCISYGYFADLEDPSKFSAIERWESRAHLDAHLRTPHVADLLAALRTALLAPPVATVYEVASSSGLF